MEPDNLTVQFKFAKGQIVKSILSGLVGTIENRADNYSGTRTYWVQPQLDSEGKYQEGRWFVENELVQVAIGRAPGA